MFIVLCEEEKIWEQGREGHDTVGDVIGERVFVLDDKLFGSADAAYLYAINNVPGYQNQSESGVMYFKTYSNEWSDENDTVWGWDITETRMTIHEVLV